MFNLSNFFHDEVHHIGTKWTCTQVISANKPELQLLHPCSILDHGYHLVATGVECFKWQCRHQCDGEACFLHSLQAVRKSTTTYSPFNTVPAYNVFTTFVSVTKSFVTFGYGVILQQLIVLACFDFSKNHLLWRDWKHYTCCMKQHLSENIYATK